MDLSLEKGSALPFPSLSLPCTVSVYFFCCSFCYRFFLRICSRADSLSLLCFSATAVDLAGSDYSFPFLPPISFFSSVFLSISTASGGEPCSCLSFLSDSLLACLCELAGYAACPLSSALTCLFLSLICYYLISNLTSLLFPSPFPAALSPSTYSSAAGAALLLLP